MANQWYKFYGGEYLSDPKIGRLNPSERSCWVTLLCLASMSNGGEIEFLTTESLLEKAGIKWNPYKTGDYEDCQNVLVKFASLKMIKVSNDESRIEILNWNKRQDHNLTDAERSKKYRDNKKKTVQKSRDGLRDDVPNAVTKKALTNKAKLENRHNESDESNARIEENRIEENTIQDTNTAETSSALVNKLIEIFSELNPACKKMYGNKTQRQACQDLIDSYSFEEVQNCIFQVLPKTNGRDYFPTITTPVQLRDKWVALKLAVAKKRGQVIEIIK